MEEKNVNITGIRIVEKENGTLIDIFATKKFKEKEIILDIRNRWLHVDVYGAKVDTTSLNAVETAGIVSQIRTFQMAETASLSFKLKKDVLGRELVMDSTGNNFHVNLRTKEIISENQEREKIKSELEEQKKRWIIDTIVVDAGHGGKDPGAISKTHSIQEKDIMLSLAEKTQSQFEQAGIKSIMTRSTDDFVSLQERIELVLEKSLVDVNSVSFNVVKAYRDKWLAAEPGTDYYRRPGPIRFTGKSEEDRPITLMLNAIADTVSS